jgi:hypothetical protein
MREYLADVRENWRDSYWRADHPEFQMAVAIAGFLILSLLRVGVNIFDLLITRRLTDARPVA